MEAEVGVMHFEDGGRVQECQWLLEAGKGKEMEFPLESPEGRCPADTMIWVFRIPSGFCPPEL